VLEIKHLSLTKKTRGLSQPILTDICLAIPKEGSTLLLGKSGSGKTSLLRCITQIEEGYEGSIFFDGVDLKKMTPRERSHLIGFVPQSFALFPHLNVIDNCLLAKNLLFKESQELSEKKVKEILDSLDILSLAQSYPHELSGGQQQRVAIARALALGPSYLLFDEPTSALDPINTELLIQIIFKLKTLGKGLLISSQDMGFSRKIIERAHYLEQGVLIESFDAQYSSNFGFNISKFLS
jgi:ABC-type polar amino acid transport system ATPase subunit